MAFGDGPDDDALRTAWARFCDQLRAAGDAVFKHANPAAPLHRADAFRFLTQNLGQAFDLGLETRDPAFPLIHDFCNPLRKLGGDCADYTYRQAWISGEHCYRVTGTRGTARFFNITVQGPRGETNPVTGAPSLHEPFGDVPEANLLGEQLVCGADGRFGLFIGGPQRGPNWLPTTPGSRKLFIREGFDHWDETPSPLSIERIGMDAPRPMPTPETMIAGMDWAGTFLTGMMRDWPDHPYAHSGGAVDPSCPNRFPPDPAGDGGDAKRGRMVANMVWHLAADEALILTFDAIDAFWMVSLGGVFMNSFDYLYRPVSYTPSRTRVDSDGKVRLVLCDGDPGVHNWLDSQGFAQGNLAWRQMQGGGAPHFETQLVPRAKVMAALPAETVLVSPAERAQQLHDRFDGIRRRYGL